MHELRLLSLAAMLTAATPTAAQQHIIDDSAPAASFRVLSGNWSPSTSVAGYLGSGYRHDENARGGSEVVFDFRSLTAASERYEIATRWTAGPNRSSVALYRIAHAGGTSDFFVDQRSNGGAFQTLGEFQGPITVYLRNDMSDGFVIADAVRVARVTTTTTAALPPGFESGLDVEYVDSTTVRVLPGTMDVDGRAWRLEAPVDVDTVPSASGRYVYLYVEREHGDPSQAVYVDTVAPTKRVEAAGWYHPTQSSDRVLAALFMETDGTLRPFRMHHGDYVLAELITLTSGGAPNGGAWQSTTTPAATVLPINTRGVLARVSSRDRNGLAHVYVTTAEQAAFGRIKDRSANRIAVGYDSAMIAAWIALGPSRNLAIAASFDDDLDLAAYVHGYRIDR